MKNDEAGARRALRRLRGRDDVDDEIAEMEREKGMMEGAQREVYTFKMFFKDKTNHVPLVATVALQVFFESLRSSPFVVVFVVTVGFCLFFVALSLVCHLYLPLSLVPLSFCSTN